MRKVRGGWKNENGEIMLESILVVIPTLFILVFLLSLGFLLYQKWNIQYLADDVAEKVALRYEYIDEELPTPSIELKDAQKTVLYKYLFHMDDYLKATSRKAQDYGSLLAKKTGYGTGSGDEVIEVEQEEDSLARRHIQVTVTGTYRIPFSEGLEIFGIDGERTFSAVSYAECVDIGDYMNTVVFGQQAGNILMGNSKVLGMINSWIGVFSQIIND